MYCAYDARDRTLSATVPAATNGKATCFQFDPQRTSATDRILETGGPQVRTSAANIQIASLVRSRGNNCESCIVFAA